MRRLAILALIYFYSLLVFQVSADDRLGSHFMRSILNGKGLSERQIQAVYHSMCGLPSQPVWKDFVSLMIKQHQLNPLVSRELWTAYHRPYDERTRRLVQTPPVVHSVEHE